MEQVKDEIIVICFFKYEGGCSGGNGKGGVFFLKQEGTKEIMEIKLNSIFDSLKSDRLSIYCSGKLEKGNYMHCNIASNIGYSCCSGYIRYENFLFTKEKSRQKLIDEREIEEEDYYNDPYEHNSPWVVSYDQALDMCDPLEDLYQINKWNY